jgi:hypothetical protein
MEGEVFFTIKTHHVLKEIWLKIRHLLTAHYQSLPKVNIMQDGDKYRKGARLAIKQGNSGA